MPAFAERSWTAGRGMSLEKYCRIMRKSADKPARLIADK
jgi:hypothetical protein